MHSLCDYHLCVDLVGLLKQLPAILCDSVSRSDLTREYQTWRLQHKVAVYNPDNLTNWFRSWPKVSQNRRTSCAEEVKDARE